MEGLSDKIKLPSNWSVVTTDSIWKFLQTISKTGNVFNKEQLTKSGLYTNSDDIITRNLSYLKYLDFIDEERAKGKEQRFKVKETKAVNDLLYELKANRENQALEKLNEHLKKHILFSTIKDDFFGDSKEKTLNDLEHFIRDSIPGKAPKYYQKGGEFIIKLLHFAKLTTLNDKDITLNDTSIGNGIIVPEHQDIEILRQEDGNETKLTSDAQYEDAQIVPTSTYQVHFRGPGMDSRLEISDIDDLLIVEATLGKIKKKLGENN